MPAHHLRANWSSFIDWLEDFHESEGFQHIMLENSAATAHARGRESHPNRNSYSVLLGPQVCQSFCNSRLRELHLLAIAPNNSRLAAFMHEQSVEGTASDKIFEHINRLQTLPFDAEKYLVVKGRKLLPLIDKLNIPDVHVIEGEQFKHRYVDFCLKN